MLNLADVCMNLADIRQALGAIAMTATPSLILAQPRYDASRHNPAPRASTMRAHDETVVGLPRWG